MKYKDKSDFKLWLILIAILFIIILTSLNLGRYEVSLTQFLNAVKDWILGSDSELPPEVNTVIFKIRMPRIIASILIGSSLAVSGTTYQALFKNPLVSPEVLGASSGAAFGAALGILLNQAYLLIVLSSFTFGIISVLISFIISERVRFNKNLGLVLSGMMVSSIFTALISVVKLLSDTENTLPSITYWLMGSLSSIKWMDIKVIIIPISIGLILLFQLRWRINLLTLSEEESKSLGINMNRLKRVCIFAATLLTSASVSVSGMIGWIGLVIPHFVRLFFGSNNKFVIPASMLIGSIYLLIIDNFARFIGTQEIPLGILTSLIGAPFFIYLMMLQGEQI